MPTAVLLSSNGYEVLGVDINVDLVNRLNSGKSNLMEKDLKQVLKYDRKNANTLNALGYSLTIHTERYEEAYNFIHQAYHYDPGSPGQTSHLS